MLSASLASFLKTKATKAYQFGEGLVKSMTARPQALADEPQRARDESLEQEATVIASPSVGRKGRPPAISMQQQRDKVSLKDYYEQGPITPKRDLDNSLMLENIDTQVMNIEADFEQLDIGEEPIFERNVIKKTSLSIFKDKMAFLQVRPGESAFKATEAVRRRSRAKSSSPGLERALFGSQDAGVDSRANEAGPAEAMQQEEGRSADEDTLSDGPIGRFSNTIDFSSSALPIVPNTNRQTERLTFGVAGMDRDESSAQL